jgi:translation elongation factor EF-Tu-like GTPase
MEFLSEVEDIFDITGRGYVIVPGIHYSFQPPLKIGAKLIFCNPNGTEVKTILKGVEMINRGKPMDHGPLLVDSNVKKGDIQIGAALFYVPIDENI